MRINPYEVLSVDLTTDYDEIIEHYKTIYSEINSSDYSELQYNKELLKMLSACDIICDPEKKAAFDSTLSEKKKREIYKNADLFRKALNMKQMIEASLGKEVIVDYCCHDFMTSERGVLNSVKGFMGIELDNLNIPFVSPGIVIHRIVDAETRKVLYYNSRIPYRKMSKEDTLKLMASIFGKGTAKRQELSKRMLNYDAEKSNKRVLSLMEKLFQSQTPDGYINFAENNSLTAEEFTLINFYYPDSQYFRFFWKNYNKGISYKMTPKKSEF